MQKPQSELLAQYTSILSNAQHHPLISAAIASKGYDATKVAEGVSLLKETKMAFTECTSASETKAKCQHDYTTKRKEVSDVYRAHRKKIKNCCEEGCETCKSLLIDGRVPKNHTKWVEMMRQFYAGLQNSESIKHIGKTSITQATAKECCKAIDEMQDLKQIFEGKKQTTQEITQRKISDMKAMTLWIRTFQAKVSSVVEENAMHKKAIGLE